jgi:phosphoadenosine phosphosulfate reductase
LSDFPGVEPIVAFSGGKDSAATAHLVSRVARPSLFFSNTTMEYPDTYEYISSFAESFGLKLVREEPDVDFLTMCERLDPPSRLLRWCCSVFKGTLLSRFLNRLDHEAINFDGIRRRESNRRSKYDRVTRNPKVVKQITFRPIIDWTSLEVWLYNFWRDLPLNPLYFKGFGRVGCYPCPNNTDYDDFLTSEYYPELWAQWQERLARFFDQTYGHGYDQAHRDRWLGEGLWKKRMPHRNTEYSTVSHPCLEQNGLFYEMSKPLDNQLVQFLKPLGEVRSLQLGDKVGLSLTQTGWYQVSGTLSKDNHLTVTFLNGRGFESKLLIQRQLRKWLNCIGCGACAGSCPTGAIGIQAGSFQIADDLCTKCQECVRSDFTKQGCVALSYKSNSVRIREER